MSGCAVLLSICRVILCACILFNGVETSYPNVLSLVRLSILLPQYNRDYENASHIVKGNVQLPMTIKHGEEHIYTGELSWGTADMDG